MIDTWRLHKFKLMLHSSLISIYKKKFCRKANGWGSDGIGVSACGKPVLWRHLRVGCQRVRVAFLLLATLYPITFRFLSRDMQILKDFYSSTCNLWFTVFFGILKWDLLLLLTTGCPTKHDSWWMSSSIYCTKY